MTEKGGILKIIFSAVDEINLILPKNRRLTKSVETNLRGLDSLGLVSFIVATEEKIEEQLGFPISLTDEEAMSQKGSPFKTIGTLKSYISSLLEKRSNERTKI